MAEVKVKVTELPSITLDSFTNNDSFLIIDDGKTRRITRAVLQEWIEENLQGRRGEQGVAGRDGVRGTNGKDGADGNNGLSAYQIAVQNGFVGSNVDWLESLKGEAAAKGEDGGDGWTPVLTAESFEGGSYLRIIDWVGGTGDKPDILGYVSSSGVVDTIITASNLRGERGVQGFQGEQGEQGIQGEQGLEGERGEQGLSAYDIAVLEGFEGTEEEWLVSLNPSEVSKAPNNIISKKIDGMFAEAPAYDPEAMALAIDALPDKNIMTDAQKAKLEELKTSKYLGTFLTPEEIPLEGAENGSYADVNSGEDGDVTERWIYNSETNTFVNLTSPTRIKEVYESNPDTNAFTDFHKQKLETLNEVSPETLKVEYESNPNTNAFTDSDKVKLDTLLVNPPFVKLFDDRVEGDQSVIGMGVTVVKSGVGEYTLQNTTGLPEDRQNILLPRDINGNYLVSVEVVDSGSTINIKTFARTFDSTTGLFGVDTSQPIDIPTGNWVEVWLKDTEE